MKKRIISFCLMLVILCSSVAMLSACGDPWEGYTEVTNRTELLAAVENEEVSKIKVVAGDYGSAEDYQNVVITRPLTIKGEGNTKPVIYGSIVVLLDDAETEPVTIENLEVSHSGLFVSNTEFSTDGRRGIMVKNGGAIIKNNYIHLTDENPETKLYAASTGIQLSVASTNTVQDQLTYVVEGNRIGKYVKAQTSANSEPTGINCIKRAQENINLTREQVTNIYNNNTFDANTECYVSMFDYEAVKYIAGAFSTEANAKDYMGNNYSYLAEGLEVKEVNGAWIIAEQVAA